MPVNDELGKRMKEKYESVPNTKLVHRMPVILRIDGKAFHTFTRGFERPFDEILIKTMQNTMQSLCSGIQGCVFGYTQSDEISLLLIDYSKLTSEAWFDYRVQKICSVAASKATLEFNKNFHNNINDFIDGVSHFQDFDVEEKYLKALDRASNVGAMFDCRCFNIPKEEVTNYFYWRQLDAMRNSIQMVGQSNFSSKELMNKNCDMIQEMLFEQKGISWDDYSTYQKRGSCCIKTDQGWIIDKDIPIFKGEDREYIDKLVDVGE